MAFRFQNRRSTTKELRRIASEQVDKAIEELKSASLTQAKQVHQVRKRCKKLRGLLRLVRPAIKEVYGVENAWYRDTAKPLSALRDAKTSLDTYDDFVEFYRDQIDRKAFGSIRRRLTLQRKAMLSSELDASASLQMAHTKMVQARNRICDWSLDESGFDAIRDGLRKNFSQAEKAMKQSIESPTAESLHEWRKRAKYHWYHCLLLSSVWPAMLKARAGEADQLGNLLGLDHDYAVLRDRILQQPDAFGSENDVHAFIALADKRSKQLQRQAFQIGERLFGECPSHFVQRIGGYWKSTFRKH